MVIAKLYLFLSFLLALAAIRGTCAVQFNVIDLSAGTPGGARFAKEVGVEYTRETMISSTNFIWNFLQLYNNVDRKNFTNVTLFVERWIKGAAGVTLLNQINVSAVYIEQCVCNIKFDFTGLIYHEMTRVWQWNGEGQAPGGLVEGIAQFIRLKAHYAPPNFGKPGAGDRWDQGYDITARFLEYCENLRHGFVMQLNKKMRTSFNVHYFVELLGKPVDQLWREYKAKYGH